jgi:predicted RNase H-like HicB family nuclease/DNA-binding XRE family transcriptional regulator
MDDGVDRSELTPEELAEARHYALLIEWSPEDGAFIVSVPDLPGVHTHGATRAEAAAMGDEVVAVVVGYLRSAGRPVPLPSPYSGCVTISRPPAYSANRIREIRRSFNVSQRVFAEMLNVSLATVRAWEQGARTPDGAATRLLSIAEHRPEIILELASSADKMPERLARIG